VLPVRAHPRRVLPRTPLWTDAGGRGHAARLTGGGDGGGGQRPLPHGGGGAIDALADTLADLWRQLRERVARRIGNITAAVLVLLHTDHHRTT